MGLKCLAKYNNYHKLHLVGACNTAMVEMIYSMYISNSPLSSTMESERKLKIYQYSRIPNFPKHVYHKYRVHLNHIF
jgi:hypothetical protein